MMRTGTLIVALAFAASAVNGCGGSGTKNNPFGGGPGDSGAAGSSGASTGSGVTGTKLVSALTADDKGKICDWLASLVGGYGKADACGMGRFHPPVSKDDCTTNFATCDATVSDFEGCQKAMAGLQTMCSDTALGTAFNTAACQATGNAGC
jgi:hypothetical protein